MMINNKVRRSKPYPFRVGRMSLYNIIPNRYHVGRDLVKEMRIENRKLKAEK